MTPNERALLEAIAYSELGEHVIKGSDNGYNVFVGSTPIDIHTFASYATHPNQKIVVTNAHGSIVSDAAGRYQLMARYFKPYAVLLKLKDFGHDAQDQIALQQAKEKGALQVINSGNFEHAIALCSVIWASLPGSPYGQHEQNFNYLKSIYLASGGTITT